MVLDLSATKEAEATLDVQEGKDLIQGVGYTVDKRGCEGN